MIIKIKISNTVCKKKCKPALKYKKQTIHIMSFTKKKKLKKKKSYGAGGGDSVEKKEERKERKSRRQAERNCMGSDVFQKKVGGCLSKVPVLSFV
jgi:hypothetical protein